MLIKQELENKQWKAYSWLTKENREKWKKDWDKKVLEKIKFTRKMMNIQKMIDQRKQVIRNKFKEKISSFTNEDTSKIIDNLKMLKSKRNQERMKLMENRKKERIKILNLAKHSQNNNYSYVNPKVKCLERLNKKITDKRNTINNTIEENNEKDLENSYKEILKKYYNDNNKLELTKSAKAEINIPSCKIISNFSITIFEKNEKSDDITMGNCNS